MLVRRNPPSLALWFSASLAILYLTSAILFLAACTSGSSSVSLGLRRVECPQGQAGVLKGPSPVLWDIVVALSLMSTILYATHAGMAVYVRRVIEREDAESKRRGDVALAEVDPEEAREARERWTRLGRYEL